MKPSCHTRATCVIIFRYEKLRTQSDSMSVSGIVLIYIEYDAAEVY